MNRDIIIRTMENYQIEGTGIQFLQCGSSIYNTLSRDIDIIIYTCNDLHDYFMYFLSQFDKNVIKKRYIYIWNMYSLKIKENNEIISFHIVSFEDLKSYVDRADEIEIYTDINLFSLSMKLPTVYRKWIKDTKHLCGDNSLKEQLELMLSQHKMPVTAIQDMLKKRINNSINYYFEKSDSDLFSGIIISQIFNDLVLYCYAENNFFYGTLKYVESDLLSFENCAELSKRSIELFKSINREDKINIVKRLQNIRELLY